MVTCCAVSSLPSNISGLIFSRCCTTTSILCRSFAAVVAFLCIFLSPQFCLPDILGSGQAVGQALLWCHTDVTWGGRLQQRAKQMSHGSFWGQNVHLPQTRTGSGVSLNTVLSQSPIHSLTHICTHSYRGEGMSQKAERGSAAVCVRIWALSGSVCRSLSGMLVDSLHVYWVCVWEERLKGKTHTHTHFHGL